MSTALQVPLSEYLGHTYDPDCEYIDGVLVDRNVGEISHSDAQSALNAYVRYEVSGFWSGVEVRVQVKAERFRIPDVTIVRGGKPAGRNITGPPEITVEILSPDDRAAEIQDKIDDYLAFGVPCVWVIRTDTRRAWIYTKEGSREAMDSVLRNPAGDVEVPLSAIFVD
jgi:Uma2 family endonuclease